MGQVVPVKLDVDRKEVAPIAAKYHVSAIPAVFILSAEGAIVGEVQTTMEPAKFAAQIQAILKKHKPGSLTSSKKTARH